MAVYVDWLMDHGWIIRGRPTRSCHMFADSLGELTAMADRLALKRAWLQRPKAFPHFDLTPAKRALAVAAGAVEIRREDWRAKVNGIKRQVADGTYPQ